MLLSASNISSFRRSLLRWYQRHRRPLPFRKTRDPYRIWLSEIMLQQTTVATVLGYYQHFIKAFPDIASVAHAKEEELLKLWQGLGYYSRVRHFQAACRRVMDAYGGAVPKTAKELKTLKGVGDYTAAAIASICFDEPVAVVDGNVKRVLARLFGYRRDSETAAARKYFAAQAGWLLDPKRPGDFNQALMELGALVCLPNRLPIGTAARHSQTKPKCRVCPIRRYCRSFHRRPERLPVKKRQTFRSVSYAALVIHRHGMVLLKKPDPQNLIANMWELPCLYENKTKPAPADWQRLLGAQVAPSRFRELGQVRHTITNKRIKTHVYTAPATGLPLTNLRFNGFEFVAKGDLDKLAVNTLSRKILKKFV